MKLEKWEWGVENRERVNKKEKWDEIKNRKVFKIINILFIYLVVENCVGLLMEI